MEAILSALLAWVAAHPHLACGLIFLVAFAESLAVVGLLVPGAVLLFGAGALIATGHLDFWPACIAAVLGAILGDLLSYGLGRVHQQRIRGLWPFSRWPAGLDHGVAFFERHGAMGVVFGRFVGPLRPFLPLAAGMLGMSPGRFLAAAVPAGIAWAPAYLLPGVALGASLKLAAEAAARLAVLLLLLLALLWATAALARWLYRLLGPHAAAAVQALLRWSAVHPRMGRVAAALADPTHPDAATLTALAVALLAATAVLGASLTAGLLGTGELVLNQAALDLAQSLRTPWADALMLSLSRLGSPALALPLMFIIAAWLRLTGHRRDAAYWLAAAAFALVALPALGLALRVPRPDLDLPAATWADALSLGLPPLARWSFPSLPVLAATLGFGFLAIAWSRDLPVALHPLAYISAAVLIAAVALARVYLGLEWLTDVLGSAALGLAWVAALGLAFRRHSPRRPHPGRLIATVMLTGGALFGALTLARQPADLLAVRPLAPDCELPAAAWAAGADGGQLPARREDLWQRNQRPFDLQYAGDLDGLADALAPLGWQPAEPLGWHNALRLLSPSQPLAALPVIPQVHAGRHEALVLVRDPPVEGASVRQVLRLWDSGCRLDLGAGAAAPLWLGALSDLRKHRVLDLLVLPLTAPAGADGSAVASFRADLTRLRALAVVRGRPMSLAPAALDLLPAE